jgi:hypothetical protein
MDVVSFVAATAVVSAADAAWFFLHAASDRAASATASAVNVLFRAYMMVVSCPLTRRES